MAISEQAQRNHDALLQNHVSTLKMTGQGCEPQLTAHVAMNLAVGNDRRVLIGTITQLLPFIGYPRTLNALRVINEGTSA
jgi:alkylhydroperoxidase/carboxymuconolactone decarboxylase family protein YurZ